ncbi:MAG TPA: NlpC/P60 family protein [Candidatus Eisenbacteria bacterium]|nr:NlpC/P60 family protein [Candidatus Eisenbacteria bacterium]
MSKDKKQKSEKLSRQKRGNKEWKIPKKDVYVEEQIKRKMPAWLIPSLLVLTLSIFLIWFVPQLIGRYQENKNDTKPPVLEQDPFFEKADAVVNQKTVRLYDQASLSANRLTSCLFNEPVHLLKEERENGFYWVELQEGIKGYVLADYLTLDISSLTSDSIVSKAFVINGEKYIASDAVNGDILAVAPMGSVLYADYVTEKVIRVILPGQEIGWVSRENILVLNSNQTFPQPASKAAELFCSSALKFLNAAYVPGGLTLDGIDMPGIIYLSGQTNGIDISRDLEQQAEIGTQISFEFDGNGMPILSGLKVGDLLFFSINDEDSNLSSAGIYLEDNNMLYAYGNQSSIDVVSFQDNEKLLENLVKVRRLFD